MERPTLVIMAAGMGSRYGGLKQIDPIGPGGEFILDYSLFDAMRAGFEKAVVVTRKEMFQPLRESVLRRVGCKIPIEIVFQNLDALPEGYSVPEGRTKPWGTAHAVLCCANAIDGPFAVINADDFYGAEAFRLVYRFLSIPQPADGKRHFCMAGYRLDHTLTENGSVARGVCETDTQGLLKSIVERTRIMRREGKVCCSEDGTVWRDLPPQCTVSMNCWGFGQEMLDEIADRFPVFLDENHLNPKAEYFLPGVVNALLAEGKADVRVLNTSAKWFGVTYQNDRPAVAKAIRGQIEMRRYPERLWE